MSSVNDRRTDVNLPLACKCLSSTMPGQMKRKRHADQADDETCTQGQRMSALGPASILPQLRASWFRTTLKDLRTIVINLDRRPDRMQSCAERLGARCPGLKFEQFAATDGRRDRVAATDVTYTWNTARNCVYQRKRAIRKGWNDLDTYLDRDLGMSPGERGCASSHIRAWQKCIELAATNADEPLLVLEDDAAPTPEFVETLGLALEALPPNADILYLGYSQASDWRREVSPNLVESEYVWTTVAYIVWPSGARKFLSMLPIDVPVDNWMAGLNADGHVNAFCVRPKVVLQAEAWNVNSDVAHSDEHYWGPDSDITHTDQLNWGPEDQVAKRLRMANSLLWDVEDSDADSDENSA